MAYATGRRIVDMVKEDLTPSKIMTRKAFENAIAVNTAIGGSTNAPNHLNAIAAHLGIELTVADWEKHGYDLPLLVNLQPAGEYLGEDYHRAGGVPAVVAELIGAGKIHEDCITANGKTIGENCKGKFSWDRAVIREFAQADEGARGLQAPDRQSLRQRHHEDLRDLGGIPPALSLEPEGPQRLRGQGHRVRRPGGLPRPHRRSEAGRSTRTPSCSSAASARWAIRVRRKSSTCARPTTCSRRASARSPAWATAASPARPVRPRSSTPRRKRQPAAASPS